jgi:hypothetical protein
MTLQDSLRDAVMLDGMLVRALDGIDDWTKAEALQAEVGLEDGRDPKTYGPYLAGRNVGWGNLITRGIGQWFGAFEGDQIVATAGHVPRRQHRAVSIRGNTGDASEARDL